MDKLILDFEGEMLEIPSGWAYERSLIQLGMKVQHGGQMYEVVDRHIVGVDDVADEFAKRGENLNEELENGLALVIRLEKA